MRVVLSSILAALLVARTAATASAEETRLEGYVEDLGPALPPPPASLPHLWHPTTDLGLDVTTTRASVRGAGGMAVALLAPAAEVPIGDLRRLYAGVRLPLAIADTERAGAKPVLGNAEVTARLVFPMPAWLAFASSLGIVVPTARMDRGSPAQDAAVAAATMEPTEIALLTPNAFGVRPAFDVRLLRGPFVVQVRDGIDLVMDTARGWQLGAAGRVVAHAGAMPIPTLELSLEASQVYFFTNGDVFGVQVTDAKRTALTIGPFVRVAIGDVDVGIGATTNIQSPLASEIDRFVALRMSVIAHPF